MSRAVEFDLEAEEQREAEQALRLKQRQHEEVEEIVERMSTTVGRRSVARQLDDCGVYRSSFNPNNAHSAFNEGQRRVGVDLLELVIRHCPQQYLEMEKERLRNGSQ
jgi:hypothetical protein